MATYYISPNGSNENTGLTEETALLTLNNATSKAVSGDKICFLEGHHIMTYTGGAGIGIGDSSVSSALIFDRNKNLIIYARTPLSTILDGTGQITTARDSHVFCLNNTSTVAQNLNIIFEPKKTTNYSSAIFGYNCVGNIISCNFNVIGKNAYKSYNYSSVTVNALTVVNCNFNFESPLPIEDYAAGINCINCIFPTKPTKGTTTYSVLRQATQQDLLVVASDCFQLGNPTILNTDDTRSHIGIRGGSFGGLWASVPKISDVDRNIGKQDKKPEIVYQIDGTGDLTVIEYINDEMIQTIFHPSYMTDINFYVPDKTWHILDNSPSQMKIVATTSGGSDTRIIDFIRSIYKIDFKTKPNLSLIRPFQITVNIDTTALPENVTLKVSNNAFDDTPAWETIAPGIPYRFINTAKSDLNWGVSAWLTAERGSMDRITISNIDIEIISN